MVKDWRDPNMTVTVLRLDSFKYEEVSSHRASQISAFSLRYWDLPSWREDPLYFAAERVKRSRQRRLP